MIISKTPFRISFFGGGTDYPKWYNQFEGKILSTTINKYSYVMINFLSKIYDYNYRIRYYINERVFLKNQISHPTVRNFLKLVKEKKKIDILNFNDLVAMSGIGSSSSFTVGLIKAYYELIGKKISKEEVFKTAIYIEQILNNESVGSQDQISCTLGGFNSISFKKKKFIIKNLDIYKNIKIIQDSTLFVYTNITRNSSAPARDLLLNLENKKNVQYLKKIYEITNEAEKLIMSKSFSNKQFGNLFNESWVCKKECSDKISNRTIENIYQESVSNGAYGAKVLGAGGGGFMLIYAEKSYHKKIRDKLRKFKFIDIEFSKNGSEIIYNSRII